MAKSPTYKVGINSQLIGKPAQPSGRLHTEGWQNHELTLEQFVDHIKLGHAFSAHFRESYRKTDNFVTTSVIAADIDGTMTIEEALGHEFIKNNAAFLYTTPSHTDDEHRFRVVFLLEDEISKAANWADCLYGLALKLGSDLSIKDSGRLFYGNRDAVIRTLSHTISSTEVHDLIEVGRSQRQSRRNSNDFSAPVVSPLSITADTLIKTARGDIVPFGELAEKLSVFCPFHVDRKHSAFVIRSYRGACGIHCMACNASFWQEPPPQYDFSAFDTLIEQRTSARAATIPTLPDADSRLTQFFPPEPSVVMFQKRFLPALTYAPGITVVKSPKGSGKTAALKNLISQVKLYGSKRSYVKEGFPKSILLVGHRRSLIREAAAKLGLDCYLDQSSVGISSIHFATSLDSLYVPMEPKRIYGSDKKSRKISPRQYDLLILDESEQVFSHLTAETLAKNRMTFRAYNALARAVQTAKAVVALDADLGMITLEALKALRPDDWEKQFRIIYNKPMDVTKRRSLRRFVSRKDMELELVEAIRSGKRCFVVSNSKGAVDTLEDFIQKNCGDGIKLRKITSENSRNPSEREFVGNIVQEFLKIQVLLCSPSLGTGIDITFPDGKQEVDHVFGFFYPFINTHTDIDQQLARVRNPGSVSVWFDPTVYRYETNFDVIRDDLARGYWVENAITGTDEDGRVTYNETHPLLLIMSHIVSARRASQNRIIDLFQSLRKSNGWDVEVVGKRSSPNSKNSLKGSWKEAATAVRARVTEGILGARDLTDEEVIELHELDRMGEPLTDEQSFQLKKGILRMTFNVPVSRQLVEMASDGQLKDRVEIYSQIRGQFFGSAMAGVTEELLASGGKKRLRKSKLATVIYVVARTAGVFEENGELTSNPLKKSDLMKFVEFCRHNQTVLEELTKSNLRGDLEVNPIRQLNEFLRLGGLSVKKNARKRRGGSPSFDYVVDFDEVAVMDELSRNYRNFEAAREANEEPAKP